MDPAQEAANSQTSGGYRVDTWMNITLQPMMKLWQGMPGPTNFFLSEQDAREATGAFAGTQAYRFAETIARLAQIAPHRTRPFRPRIREVVVDIATEAAVGVCVNNQDFGSGSVLQYYVPNWTGKLMPTGRSYTFHS